MFKGERFLSESTVWCKMSGPYKMLFFNIGIYECEYLNDGLSHNVHKTLFCNPKGSAECYKQMSAKGVKFLKRVKYTIAFATYSFAAKKKMKEQLKEVSSKVIYLLTFGLGYFIYLFKKRKYGNKQK